MTSAQWPSKIIQRYEIITEQYTQVSTIPTFPDIKRKEVIGFLELSRLGYFVEVHFLNSSEHATYEDRAQR